jgi:SAM-dependent methyltransferase
MSHDWEVEHAKRESWGVWPAEYMVRAVASYTGPRDLALDIGTGGGAHMRLLREAGFDTVIGQDISKTAIERIWSRDKDAFLCGCDINRMELARNSIDVIIDNLSLTHVEFPDWDKIWSWLRPGGRFVSAQFYAPPKGAPESWFHGDKIKGARMTSGVIVQYSDHDTEDCYRISGIRVITLDKIT